MVECIVAEVQIVLVFRVTLQLMAGHEGDVFLSAYLRVISHDGWHWVNWGRFFSTLGG